MRAISVLSFDTGTSTRWCFAAAALRMRVRKSAIGSVCMILLIGYQLAFTTPGISPLRAMPRKQILHISNLWMKARARPHTRQRLRARVLNFGFFRVFAIFAVRAILLRSSWSAQRKAEPLQQLAAFFVVARCSRQSDVHAF